MKKLRFIGLCIATAAMACSLISCDDNDDKKQEGGKPSNPENVFEEGVPAKVGGLAVTTNSKGQVTTIQDGYGTEKYTFNYDPITINGKQYDMSIMETNSRSGETETFYLNLNNKGYTSYCYQVSKEYGQTETQEWWFGYNSNGQLNYMKRSEGDNEVTDITYSDGDAVKVTTKSDADPSTDVTTISYTTDEYPNPTVNKGGIMLYDLTLNVDLDEMEVAYYAGLLGKATKHLPMRNVDEDGEINYFFWTFDANGLPTKMTNTYYENGNPISQSVNFVW